MKLNTKTLEGPVSRILHVATKGMDAGEIARVGGTWGFADSAAETGDTVVFVIRAALVEMDKTTPLNPASAGHIVYVDSAVDPPVLKCSGGETTISRNHIGIVHQTPDPSDTRVRVVWGGPL